MPRATSGVGKERVVSLQAHELLLRGKLSSGVFVIVFKLCALVVCDGGRVPRLQRSRKKSLCLWRYVKLEIRIRS